MRNVLMGCRSEEYQRFFSHSAILAGPGRPAGQDRGPGGHGIRAGGIAHGFDVGVLVDVNARADGHSFRQIIDAAGNANSNERLRIGSDMLAETVADVGQGGFRLQAKKKLGCAE